MRINRRALLGGVLVTAGATGAGVQHRLSTRAGRAWVLREAAKKLLPSADSLHLPLEGARVVAVHPIRFGALPVVVENDGERFQVDVCRRAPEGLAGVIDTDTLSLFVSNCGDGGADTGRTRELGARALSLALASHPESASLAPLLLSFEERAARFAGRNFQVDLSGSVVA